MGTTSCCEWYENSCDWGFSNNSSAWFLEVRDSIACEIEVYILLILGSMSQPLVWWPSKPVNFKSMGKQQQGVWANSKAMTLSNFGQMNKQPHRWEMRFWLWKYQSRTKIMITVGQTYLFNDFLSETWEAAKRHSCVMFFPVKWRTDTESHSCRNKNHRWVLLVFHGHEVISLHGKPECNYFAATLFYQLLSLWQEFSGFFAHARACAEWAVCQRNSWWKDNDCVPHNWWIWSETNNEKKSDLSETLTI